MDADSLIFLPARLALGMDSTDLKDGYFLKRNLNDLSGINVMVSARMLSCPGGGNWSKEFYCGKN